MNIEESIEILESYKESLEEYEDNPRIIQAIETLLTAYEKEKEKNKELYEIKYIASRFINRSMKQFSIGEFNYKVNNYIEWEDKIKAKIKELEKLNEEATGNGFGFAIYYLQSLLEEKE